MSTLVFYDAGQTYTNTVYEHLDCLGKYSKDDVVYCSYLSAKSCAPILDEFDVVIVHYSVRLPHDRAAGDLEEILVAFPRLKVLFIQDEYDNTFRAWYWIKRLGFQLVFTTVPDPSIATIYPPDEFPGVTFVNNLTGYVPESLPSVGDLLPPSEHQLIVGYRGRSLAMRYGDLGADKVRIGEMVKSYCTARGIEHDIAWTEESRIYGPAWYQFVASARSTLSTESGSNVFDWAGTIDTDIARVRAQSPELTPGELYDRVVKPLERKGIMNQISPRIFEAIALRTVLVLFEGGYSGVLVAGRHYLSLKRDGSNLDEVFADLADLQRVDELATAAYDDVIGSGRYSYSSWVSMVDGQIHAGLSRLGIRPRESTITLRSPELTAEPIRALPPAPPPNTLKAAILAPGGLIRAPNRLLHYAWSRTPERIRAVLRGPLKRLLGRSS